MAPPSSTHPLRAQADPTRPLGHARIVLPSVASGTDLRFCLLREGYAAAHLGPRGWQVGEAVLEPEAVEHEGASAVLVLGPALVRHVEPGPLTLRIPALNRDLAVFWPADIAVYDEGDGSLSVGAAAAAKPKPAPDIKRGSANDETRIVPPPGPQPPPPPPPHPPPPRWPWALLALLLVAAAGGAGWWWMKEPPPQPPPMATVTPVDPAPPPPPPWPEGTDTLTPAEVVARAPDAGGIMAVAQRRQQAGRHDDALVLFEEAADRGIAAALSALGTLYDPNGFVPNQPFTAPDARQAADYYRRAALAGDTQVLAARNALKAYLEAEAAAGNVTARQALEEFWP